MKQVKGKDVMLEIFASAGAGLTTDWMAYACYSDVSIKITPELINKTTVSSGKFNSYHSRRIDWEVTLSGVTMIAGNGYKVFSTVTPANVFVEWPIRLTFADDEGNNGVFTGSILLKDATLTGNQGEFSGYDNTFQGTGAYDLSINGVAATGGSPPPATLNAPGSPYVNALTTDGGTAHWTDTNTSPNESGVRIKIATDNGFLSVVKVVSLPPNANVTNITGLNPDTDYYISLQAVGNGFSTLDSLWTSGVLFHTSAAAATTFTVEYGQFDADPYATIIAGTPITLGSFSTVAFGAPISVVTPNVPSKFFVVRYPNTESSKTLWYNTAFNNGSIPDSVFRATETVGGYKYIISRTPVTLDPLQQTTFS